MRDIVFYKIKSGDMVELFYDNICYRVFKVYNTRIFLDSSDIQYVTVKNDKHEMYGPFGARFIKNIL